MFTTFVEILKVALLAVLVPGGCRGKMPLLRAALGRHCGIGYRRKSLRLSCSLVVSTLFAHGHHGQDFLVNVDARAPEQGGVVTFVTGAFSDELDGDEWSVESGFLVGLGGGFSVGASAEWLDEGEGLDFESVSPLVQWAAVLSDDRWRVGLAARYVFADEGKHGARDGHSHSHSKRGRADETSLFGKFASFNPDRPPIVVGGGHSHGADGGGHGGIHRHGENLFVGRAILEWQPRKDLRLVANYLLVSGGNDDFSHGYSFGTRFDINHHLGVGLEAIGDFDTKGEHEVFGGVWWSPTNRLNLRVGIGHGVGAFSPGTSVVTGVTWRF